MQNSDDKTDPKHWTPEEEQRIRVASREHYAKTVTYQTIGAIIVIIILVICIMAFGNSG